MENPEQNQASNESLPLSQQELAGLTRPQIEELFKLYFELNRAHNFQPQFPDSEGTKEIHAALQAKIKKFRG
ncbi:MAG: hypothetical protein M3Q73_01280 [bacterium]|nr:hypothetical protein [bacterium]